MKATILAGMLMIFVGGKLINGNSLNAADSDPGTPAKRLLSFIENPPVIEELVAMQRARFNNEFRTTYVLIRHQTNAMFYREAFSLEDLYGTNSIPGLRMAGHYDDEIWNFGLDGVTLMDTQDGAQSLKHTIGFIRSHAGRFLTIGFDSAVPGPIEFNDLAVIPYTNSMGVHIEGSLRPDSSGDLLPLGWDIVFRSAEDPKPRIVEFEYFKTGNLPNFIPNKITSWALRENAEKRLLFGVEILNLTTSATALPREMFMPESYMHNVVHTIRSSASGTAMRNSTLNPTFVPVEDEKSRYAWVIVLVIILVSAGVVMVVRLKQKH